MKTITCKGAKIYSKEWKRFKKKPVVIEAVKLKEDIEIETLEGTMKGNKGDWLIIGVRGEAYSCRNDIFEETYDEEDKEEMFVEKVTKKLTKKDREKISKGVKDCLEFKEEEKESD